MPDPVDITNHAKHGEPIESPPERTFPERCGEFLRDVAAIDGAFYANLLANEVPPALACDLVRHWQDTYLHTIYKAR